MKKIVIGKTKLEVTKTAFGVLPLQRADTETAIRILRMAYEGGINFFDTARGYSNSEEKIGISLGHVREEIILASKTHAKDSDTFWEHLNTSLKMLKTDYIDIYQFHNPASCPKPGDGSGIYEAMLEAKAQGMIRHIGITNHRQKIALEAIDSGLYETLQYPLSYLSDDNDMSIYKKAISSGMGFIAMKALAGGILTDARPVFSFFEELDGAVPIYGMQKEEELKEFLTFSKSPPTMTEELLDIIKRDKEELRDNFCRGCGYCLPCPAEIKINMVARMKYLLRRGVWQNFVTEDWQVEMRKVNDCIDCGACKERCPYGINCPELMRYMLKDYNEFVSKLDKDIK